VVHGPTRVELWPLASSVVGGTFFRRPPRHFQFLLVIIRVLCPIGPGLFQPTINFINKGKWKKVGIYKQEAETNLYLKDVFIILYKRRVIKTKT